MVPVSISQKQTASLRRLLVKSGLNAGGCKARANTWNHWGIYPRTARESVPIGDTRRIARRVSHIGPSLASILERIELVLAGHRDRERTQRMLHLDRTRVLGQHLRQPAIGHRTFIEVGAYQRHAARLQPGVHLDPREPPLGLLAAKQAAGAVHRRVQRSPRLLAVDTLDDHSVVAHRSADEAALAGKCR